MAGNFIDMNMRKKGDTFKGRKQCRGRCSVVLTPGRLALIPEPREAFRRMHAPGVQSRTPQAKPFQVITHGKLKTTTPAPWDKNVKLEVSPSLWSMYKRQGAIVLHPLYDYIYQPRLGVFARYSLLAT